MKLHDQLTGNKRFIVGNFQLVSAVLRYDIKVIAKSVRKYGNIKHMFTVLLTHLFLSKKD